MIVRIAITILCGVGLYASIFMLRKSQRAEHGHVKGPSVVKTPQARLFGPPNSLVAVFYYPLLVVAVWALPLLASSGQAAIASIVWWCALFGAVAAAGTSLALAFSLLFITKRWCPYCWTSHLVNWLLFFLVLASK